jgi:hypothetical protein
MELLAYDPATGVFTWRVNRRGRFARKGAQAGSDSRGLYTRIAFDGADHYAHRLAWLYVHGVLPSEIDHINGDGKDNRICNLREVTRAQNNQNIRKTRCNRTGFRGVRLEGAFYRAVIQLNRRAHLSERFDSPQAAHAKYLEMREELHPCAVMGERE